MSAICIVNARLWFGLNITRGWRAKTFIFPHTDNFSFGKLSNEKFADFLITLKGNIQQTANVNCSLIEAIIVNTMKILKIIVVLMWILRWKFQNLISINAHNALHTAHSVCNPAKQQIEVKCLCVCVCVRCTH